jgi:hypothetical protein
MCARLSVLMEHLGSHWTDCHEIWYLSIFLKSVEKIQVSLNSDKNSGYFTWSRIYIFDHISLIFLEWKMFRTKVVEKIKIHILCSVTFFSSRKSYLLWDNVGNTVKPERPLVTIWRMRIACWIPKATSTHLQYVILIAARTPLSVTLCVYRLSCLLPACYRLASLAPTTHFSTHFSVPTPHVAASRPLLISTFLHVIHLFWSKHLPWRAGCVVANLTAPVPWRYVVGGVVDVVEKGMNIKVGYFFCIFNIKWNILWNISILTGKMFNDVIKNYWI